MLSLVAQDTLFEGSSLVSMNTTFVKDASTGELRDSTNNTAQQPIKFRKSGESKREAVMTSMNDTDENLSDVSDKGLAKQGQPRKRKLGSTKTYFQNPV